MRSETLTASLAAVTSSVGVYTALLPHFSDVRKSAGDPTTVNDVRLGEAAAFSVTVAIGVAASAFANSPVPAMVAILAATGMVIMYESVLQTPPKEGSK